MVSHGIRQIAETEATRQLGERSVSDIRRDYRQQVEATKVTELDRLLAKGISGGQVDVSKVKASKEARLHLAGRMRTLETMKLASYVRGHTFTIQPEFQDTLRDMDTRRRAAGEARRRLPGAQLPAIYANSAPQKTVVGTVRSAGLTEGGARAFVALDTAKGPAYAEVDPRFAPRVAAGGIVEIRPRPTPDLTADQHHALSLGKVDPSVQPAAVVAAARKQISKQKGQEEGGVLVLTPAGTRAMRSDLGLGPAPPRLRVLAARAPEKDLNEPRWSPLDRFVGRKSEAEWPGSAKQIDERERFLKAKGMLLSDRDGQPMWRRGATKELRAAELKYASEAAAKAASLPPLGAGGDLRGPWNVVARVDLAQGPGVVLRNKETVTVELLRDVRAANAFPPGTEVGVSKEANGRGVSLKSFDKKQAQEPQL